MYVCCTIHTFIHTFIHVHINTYIHGTCICTHVVLIRAHTYMVHTWYIHSYIHVKYVHVIHTCTCTCMYTGIHTCNKNKDKGHPRKRKVA